VTFRASNHGSSGPRTSLGFIETLEGERAVMDEKVHIDGGGPVDVPGTA
jgi:hypothetical protein